MIMDFNTYQKKMKDLFVAYLLKVIPEEAYQNSPLITKEIYADTIYTDVMALGYNFGDIDKAADDKMDMTVTLLGVQPKSMGKIRVEIQETANLYPYPINVFSEGHFKIQSGENPQNVLDFIEEKLNI